MGPSSQEDVEGDLEGMRVEHPKASSVRHLWEDKATEAVLGFLRDTRVGCVVNTGRLPGEEGGGEGEVEINEEDGPGPPLAVFSFVFFPYFFPLSREP